MTLRLQEENVAWFPVIVGFWSTFKSTHTQGVAAFPFFYLEDNLCKRSGDQLGTVYPGRVSGSPILSLGDQ